MELLEARPGFPCFLGRFLILGVARGLLQERPLNFHHGNVRVKSCQPTSNTWSTSSRILYALLVGEEQHEFARARFCTQSCSKVGQLLVSSSPTPHPMGSAGVSLAVVLW